MTHLHQPKWIQEAAKSVAELFEKGHDTAQSDKTKLAASQTMLKEDAKQTELKIAGIIHKHFSNHRQGSGTK